MPKRKLDSKRAMTILAAVPIDGGLTRREVAMAVSPISDQTVYKYLEQMVRDGWLRKDGGAVKVYTRKWHLDRWFTPMHLPTAVFINEDVILGPFCRNCGWNIDMHGGRTRRCPTDFNPLLGGRAFHGSRAVRRDRERDGSRDPSVEHATGDPSR
jgi:hypothetical protein